MNGQLVSSKVKSSLMVEIGLARESLLGKLTGLGLVRLRDLMIKCA